MKEDDEDEGEWRRRRRVFTRGDSRGEAEEVKEGWRDEEMDEGMDGRMEEQPADLLTDRRHSVTHKSTKTHSQVKILLIINVSIAWTQPGNTLRAKELPIGQLGGGASARSTLISEGAELLSSRLLVIARKLVN